MSGLIGGGGRKSGIIGTTEQGTFNGTLGSSANFASIANDAISGDKLNGGSPSFASLSVTDAVVGMGTAGKFLLTNGDGGLSYIYTARGHETGTGTEDIYVPGNTTLGICFVWASVNAAHQACSIYSANFPGRYALRLVSLGSSVASIGQNGTAITGTVGAAFEWVVIQMHTKT